MEPRINIAKYRKIKFISQNKLAKKIKISQSYLSALERNEKSPTIRTLYKIGNELDVCPRLLVRCTIDCKECTKKYKCFCEGDD